MILVPASRYLVACLAALCSVNASADVMELDGDGARWVAAGSSVRSADVLALDLDAAAVVDAVPIEVADTIGSMSDAIVADPSVHASIVPARYAAKVREVSERFDLSPTLIEALVWQESRWRETAVSHAGARGLAQLMPGTARDLGVDPDDPMQNLEGGARYLREQLDRFDGDLEKALAAYNAGPGRVIRANGIPNIRETRHYVAAIMGRLSNHSRPATR